MTKIESFFKLKMNPLGLAIFSGVLVGISYIPFPTWGAFFCYLPLWFAVIQLNEKSSNLKKIFFLGWITQFLLTLIGFHWIYYTAQEFGELPIVISALALILFCSFMHLYIPLSIVFATYLQRKLNIEKTSYVFLLALTLSLFERFWPSIFPWHLGYVTLWMKWPLFQWADLVGFDGLSAYLLLTQAFLLGLLFQYKKKNFIFKTSFIVWFFGLIVLWTLGSTHAKPWLNPNQSLNIVVTQANVENAEKKASEAGLEFQPFVLNTYIEQTNQFLNNSTEKIDLLLWPETALPFPLDSNYNQRPLQTQLYTQLQHWNIPLITGGYSFDRTRKDHLGNSIVRNSMFFKKDFTDLDSPYHKTQLLVFGEYMPLGNQFPFLYKLLPFVGVYEKGPGPVQKKITINPNLSVKIGPQICYESLDPLFSIGLARAGAEILINITNDSWYGNTSEPHQHMIMNLARAVETRRPLIRSTNTGISTAILASGEVLEQSPTHQSWVGKFKIPWTQNPELTFYAQYPSLGLIIILCAILLILLKGHYVRRQKS